MAYYPSYYNPYLSTALPQQPQSSPGIVWIGSEREAAMYPVAPNGAVTLWDQNAPVVYLKQADATGKPTLKTYDLVERTESSQDARNGATDDVYATKKELESVASAVKDIDGLLTSLTKEIDKLKAAKKMVRRYEEEDDE